MQDEKIFSTSDSSLAAWLYSQGFRLQDVDKTVFPNIFRFINDTTRLAKAVSDFQTGKAEGNITMFFHAYKKMIAKVKR